MKRLKYNKLILAGVLGLSIAATGLAGCDNKDNSDKTGTATDATTGETDVMSTDMDFSGTKALVIGDYDIYMNEVMFYAIQELLLKQPDVASYEASSAAYKLEAINMIRERQILYNVAINNDVQLDDSDLEAKDGLVSNFKSGVPKELLEKFEITDELVDRLFAEQVYVAKFEKQIENDMGKKMSDDYTKAYEDYHFTLAAYMTFPTVKVDDEGNPSKDDNGNYIYTSDDEQKKMRKNAESAIEEMRSGKDWSEVAEKYGVKEYCVETSGFEDQFSDEINAAIANLETGDCTDIMDTELGYNVIYIKNKNDESLKETYIEYMVSTMLENEYSKLRESWLATIPVDEEKDYVGDTWKNVTLKGLLEEMIELGMVSPQQ